MVPFTRIGFIGIIWWPCVTELKMVYGSSDAEEGRAQAQKSQSGAKKETLQTLDTLTTPVSRNLLHQLHLNDSYLEENPELWQQSEAFCIAKTTIQSLPAVNDHAERGVAWIQNFNCRHTVNEDQFQYLLQVVEQHRKDFPSSSKMHLASAQQWTKWHPWNSSLNGRTQSY